MEEEAIGMERINGIAGFSNANVRRNANHYTEQKVKLRNRRKGS
jgi:hypothetical protein